ncbi:hypothetical protein EDB86DRAFT_2965601 [Lactarius hatsudake]|nr:hypothetical protein EDB86DRAFT_2965601 [Lactarius hatsudake]
MPLIVVYNPLTTETVLPLLTSRGLTPDKVAATEHAGHVGTLLLSYINGLAPTERAEGITLILVSGDGTLHEIVNALHDARTEKDGPFPSLRIVLVPGGTANALHSTFFPPSSAPDAEPTQLASLLAFLSGAPPRLVPLTLALTTIVPEGPRVVSVVVTSTSLHAAILHDSEALRASVPGIERFKIAAAQNATTWYRARARLLAPVQRYDDPSGAFVPLAEEQELLGPFAYFLSTVNVDRLEQHFRIAPLQRSLPPPHGTQTMDVLVTAEAERERFKDRIWGAIGGAYQDGAHVHARYANPDGKKDGPAVIEYFRVGGWEWIPEEDDEKAHLLCADGTIFHAQKGGKISSNVLARTAHDLDIAVYA